MDQSKNIKNPAITVCNQQDLHDEVIKIWSEPGCKLRKGIKYRLHNYKLRDLEASDVFTEAVLRAAKYLEKNGEISNLIGWLTKASNLIIFEHNKSRRKQLLLTQKLSNKDYFLEDEELYSFTDDQKRIALILINGLDPLKKSIVLWRIEGLKWKEVCIQLAKENLINEWELNDPKTIEKIRKIGRRSLDRIKRLIREASRD